VTDGVKLVENGEGYPMGEVGEKALGETGVGETREMGETSRDFGGFRPGTGV